MKSKKISKVLLCVCLIAIQLGICTYFATQKKSMFCDEVYSYGLSNSTTYCFLDYQTIRQVSDNGGWVTSDFYTDYVSFNFKDGFRNFLAPYINQKYDVHPPAYYYFLHLVCMMFPGSFTKWTGIGLNMFFLVLIDFVLYYITSYFFKGDKAKSLTTIVLATLCAATISNVLFIRMYTLLTLEMLLFVAVHIWIDKHGKLDKKGYLLVYFAVILGGLTHYYFYPFVFLFSAPICLYLFLRKKWKMFFKYAASLCLGFITNLALFPWTLHHVFGGYRGNEVTSNLVNSTENPFTQFYKAWIDNSIFAGTMIIFAVVFALAIIVHIVMYFAKNKGTDDVKPSKLKSFIGDVYYLRVSHTALIYALMSFAILGFAYVAIVGSSLRSNRYIYPIYPVVAIWIVSCIYWVFGTVIKNKNAIRVIAACICVALCVGSVAKYGIDFQYSDADTAHEKAKTVEGYDCLLYYPEGSWLDVYNSLELKLGYDESYYFNKKELKNIDKILDERETKDDGVVVILPDATKDSEASKILDKIIEKTDYTGYEELFHFFSRVYVLT